MITEVYTDLDLRTIPKFPTLVFVGLRKLHSQFTGSYTENAAVKQHQHQSSNRHLDLKAGGDQSLENKQPIQPWVPCSSHPVEE